MSAPVLSEKISFPRLSEQEISSKTLLTAQGKEALSNIDPNHLKALLETAFREIQPGEDANGLLNRVAEIVPLEILQDALQIDSLQHIDALQTAKSLFHEAQYYLNATQEASPTLRVRLEQILDALISILESFLNAFGIADFFQPAENPMHAEFKGQKIMMLISLFTLLSGVLLPVLGPALCGTILGGILLSISALSLIYPSLRPAPKVLPQSENWTQRCRIGQLDIQEGRKESLNEIAHTLIASKNAKIHVLLLGKTGVGKTETAKALVQAIERGDYPELQGKQVFYINTANLVHSTEMFSGANKILQRISEAMENHRDRYILVLDEIHLACQKTKKTGIGEQLKTLLDSGDKGFPYVIGITTEEEFYRDIYLENPAFARRFKRISIQNTEDPETQKILHHFLIKQAPKILFAPDAVPYLLKKTKQAFGAEAAQPGTSLKILARCIKQTEPSQRSPLEIRAEQIRSQILSRCAEGAARPASSLHSRNDPNLLEWENGLLQIESQLEKEKKEFDRLFQMKDQLFEAKKSAFKTIAAIAPLTQDSLSSKQKKQLSVLLLQTRFLAPLLEEKIRAEGTRLGLRTTLDAQLIDQTIEEEIESERKIKELLAEGKKQNALRSQ